eukprot:sb/3471199/
MDRCVAWLGARTDCPCPKSCPYEQDFDQQLFQSVWDRKSGCATWSKSRKILGMGKRGRKRERESERERGIERERHRERERKTEREREREREREELVLPRYRSVFSAPWGWPFLPSGHLYHFLGSRLGLYSRVGLGFTLSTFCPSKKSKIKRTESHQKIKSRRQFSDYNSLSSYSPGEYTYSPRARLTH